MRRDARLLGLLCFSGGQTVAVVSAAGQATVPRRLCRAGFFIRALRNRARRSFASLPVERSARASSRRPAPASRNRLFFVKLQTVEKIGITRKTRGNTRKEMFQPSCFASFRVFRGSIFSCRGLFTQPLRSDRRAPPLRQPRERQRGVPIWIRGVF